MDKSKANDFLSISNWERSTIKDLKKYSSGNTASHKSYPDAVTIPLSFSWKLDEARIKPLIQNRRSLRKYSAEILTIDDVSFVLWASQGITAKIGNKHNLRTTPSAGALYPYETYLIFTGVTGIPNGLYHLNVKTFSLELLEIGEFAAPLAKGCLNQNFIADAPINIIWTGVMDRCLPKYGDRALRYLLLDLGHLCQNLLIGAEAIGCGGCPVAAFFDSEINELLHTDGENEMPLYAASIGRKPKKTIDG